MPYITSEEIAAKRTAIKKAFPNWKFSITRRHYSTIFVAVMAAPIQLTEKEDGYEQLNRFYLQNRFKGEALEAMTKINNIAASGVRELVNDGDYGSVPTFYVDLNIGQWDKPFVYTAKKELV